MPHSALSRSRSARRTCHPARRSEKKSSAILKSRNPKGSAMAVVDGKELKGAEVDRLVKKLREVRCNIRKLRRCGESGVSSNVSWGRARAR
jgi:hypothetical protein